MFIRRYRKAVSAIISRESDYAVISVERNDDFKSFFLEAAYTVCLDCSDNDDTIAILQPAFHLIPARTEMFIEAFAGILKR